jgi:glycosyltransferase involved in cell wall biosynthesis
MKILQISHGYNAPFLGVSNHYESMLNDDNEVVTLYLTGDESEAVKQATKASRLIFWACDTKQLRGMKLGLIVKLYKLIRDEKFDLVICHRYKAIYLAIIVCLLGLKFKQVGVIHAFGAFQNLSRRLLLSLVAKRLIILGVSNAVRDDIRDSMPLFPKNKVQTLYNALDIREIKRGQLTREAARDFLGLAKDSFIIGNVGRLHDDKDQATLIKAFALFNKKIPVSQLVIIGSGRLKASLQQLTNDLGVGEKVRFSGQINNAKNYYKAFDLFALSSDKEPFGLVLLEAMAAKVPVVASDCGGAKEVVSGAGWLFNFRDVEALAEVMFRVYLGEKEELLDVALNRLETKFSIMATKRELTTIIRL